MVHECKNTHGKYASPNGKRNYKYSKWCSTCMIFMLWEGKYCPCCKYVLRCHVRTEKWKKESEYKRI